MTNTIDTPASNRQPTKKDKFFALRSVIATAAPENAAELIEFIDHEIELLNAKSGALKKPTEAQEKNKELMNALIEVLRDKDCPMTQKEIMDLHDERLADIKSAQHLNSLFIKMCATDAKGNPNPNADGRVKRIVEKGGTSYFTLNDEQ